MRRACSGLGIIRKKPEIRFKNPDEIQTLPEIQAKILANCAQYVKKGGTLVYSTCTILQRENEDVVRAFLAENPEFEAVSWTHPVCGERADGMVTLLPPVHNTDGSLLRKCTGSDTGTAGRGNPPYGISVKQL